MKHLFPVLIPLLCLSACFSGPQQNRADTEKLRETIPAPSGIDPQAGLRGEDSSLDSAAFSGCPPEALAYLRLLSQAFRNGDKGFLLAQGEGQYEKDLRPGRDEAEYFNLLYRIGPLAAEEPEETRLQKYLKVEDAAYISFKGWREKGPMIEVDAQIHGPEGALPCRIILAWRLVDIKIVGLYP
ncbi:MAG: hypothetical protein LBC57_02570 [Treponema sp.]|jgi:hypothetical protein|nr:hypothetical protein [Treponema sp.]